MSVPQWFHTWRVVLCAALGLVSFQAVYGQGDWQTEARRYGWLLSLGQGLDRARHTGRPLMVVIRCIP